MSDEKLNLEEQTFQEILRTALEEAELTSNSFDWIIGKAVQSARDQSLSTPPASPELKQQAIEGRVYSCPECEGMDCPHQPFLNRLAEYDTRQALSTRSTPSIETSEGDFSNLATPDQFRRANEAVEANLNPDGSPKYDSAQGYACALYAIIESDKRTPSIDGVEGLIERVKGDVSREVSEQENPGGHNGEEGGMLFNNGLHKGRDIAFRHFERFILDLPTIGRGVSEVETAAKALIAARFSTYRARNGRDVGVQDEQGEKVWLVPSDEMFALESALSQSSGEGL